MTDETREAANLRAHKNQNDFIDIGLRSLLVQFFPNRWRTVHMQNKHIGCKVFARSDVAQRKMPITKCQSKHANFR